MPYGPKPRGAPNARTRPERGSTLPYTPPWPVNHSRPPRSKVAVLRFTSGRFAGSGNRRTRSVRGSTRTIAFSPPSVTHGAPSGPTITPCGGRAGAERDHPAAPGPRVEAAEVAGALGGEPDGAVARGRDVVRAAARGDAELADRP